MPFASTENGVVPFSHLTDDVGYYTDIAASAKHAAICSRDAVPVVPICWIVTAAARQPICAASVTVAPAHSAEADPRHRGIARADDVDGAGHRHGRDMRRAVGVEGHDPVAAQGQEHRLAGLGVERGRGRLGDRAIGLAIEFRLDGARRFARVRLEDDVLEQTDAHAGVGQEGHGRISLGQRGQLVAHPLGDDAAVRLLHLVGDDDAVDAGAGRADGR